MSPETSLSLCRQTAGCGLVLIDSLCLFASTRPRKTYIRALGCERGDNPMKTLSVALGAITDTRSWFSRQVSVGIARRFSKVSSITLLLLAILMLLTRVPQFNAVLFLPSATLAIYFVLGFYFKRRTWFLTFSALAFAIDFSVLTSTEGSAAYCFTPAYGFIFTGYYAVWFAGQWLGKTSDFSQPFGRIKLIVITVSAISVAFFLSNASFYWLSGYFSELNAFQYASRVARYFPSYLVSPLVYLSVLAIVHAFLLNRSSFNIRDFKMKYFPHFIVPLLCLVTPFISQAQSESENFMDEIVVGASHIPIAISQSANAVTVINSEQLKSRAALTVSDLLRDVPGLAVSRSGVLGSATQIRVRGSEANHLLVLIDGVEANDPSQDDALNWATLTTSDIERIEVIRGPQSAMHGSDAVAGVVNIVTHRADKPLSASVYTEAGSRATRKNGFTIGHKSESFDVRLGASHLESDGDNISIAGDEDDGYKNTSVNLNAGWKVSDELKLSFTARQSDGMNEFDGDSNYDNIVEDQDRVSEFRNTTSGLQADYQSANGYWQHKLLIAQSDNNNESFSNGGAGNSTDAVKNQYQYVGSLFWDASAQRASLLLEREIEDFQQRGPITFANPNHDRQRVTESVALEYRADITDSLTLAASGRLDDNSEFDSAETYRLEASYQVTDSTRLRTAWGTAIKNPTFSERFGTYTNFVGNPNLQPEESTSWELGIDQLFLDGQINASATLFNAKLENEINGFASAVGGGFTASNKDGLSRRQGLELAVMADLSDTLSVNTTYTYTDSTEFKNAVDGYVDEVRRPRHIASFNLAWQAQDRLHLNANVQYGGKQTDTVYPNIVTLADYTLVNLNANFSATEKLDIYVRLDNVLDDQYEEVFSYQTLGFGASLGLRLQLR